MSAVKVLLIVGHQPWAKGAKNQLENIHEYDFNRVRARSVPDLVKHCKVVVDHYDAKGGNIARWSGASDLIIELHANAFDTKATGTETLYAEGSRKGEAAARAAQHKFLSWLGLANRGIKPKRPSDRGGYFLFGVSQPALIFEPFFIDNNKDLFRAKTIDYSAMLAAAIDSAARTLEEK